MSKPTDGRTACGGLAPIKLCAIIAGEKAPYPSCIGKSQGRFKTGTSAKFRLPAETPYR
jgi:hypothetical protein